MFGEILQTNIWRLLAISVCSLCLNGCASTICGSANSCEFARLTGEPYVRYHLGFVREVVPPVAAPEKQVFASKISTIGIWIDVDAREIAERAPRTGIGVGYAKSARQIFPRECSFVVDVARASDVEPVLEMFRNSKIGGDNVCVVSSDYPN